MLIIGDEAHKGEWVLPDLETVQLHCAAEQKIPFLGLQYSAEYQMRIATLHRQQNLDIIHDHGLWLPNNKVSALTAKKLGVPFVLSTRGMLEPWALKYHWWKKKPVWWLWQKAAIKNARLLHATAREEADNIRVLGFQNPIAVIPNGVELPQRVATHEETPERIALFLSRIHPIKGILNLVEAWGRVRPSGWKLVIAGPDEGGHQSEVANKIVKEGLCDQVGFVGPLEGKEKSDLFTRANLFVLPSYSENFGIVVAEALAAGVPVITTKGTPWSELEQQDCGWWVDIGVEPLAVALGEAIGFNDAQRQNMGLRGRQLVQEKYSWTKIAEDMISAYLWVLEGGAPPECVRLD